jgi:hypothetical protein
MRGHRFFVVGLCSLAGACGARAVPASGDAAAGARRYVVEHRVQLEQEIEIGSGAALRDLARLADCREIAELGRTLHRKRATIFPVPSPSDDKVADQVLAILTDEPQLVCRDLELGPNRPFNAGRRHVLTAKD